ncbi:MAG: ABC transporter permease [Caldilineaceae bacterium]
MVAAQRLYVLPRNPADWFAHIILPALTAGIISGAIQTRFIRSAMLEVLGEDYVRTARAKGLQERRAILRHGLRNAMIPIVTIIGLQITALLSSVVVVEVVFAWPGLGRLALNAVLDRDYPFCRHCLGHGRHVDADQSGRGPHLLLHRPACRVRMRRRA